MNGQESIDKIATKSLYFAVVNGPKPGSLYTELNVRVDSSNHLKGVFRAVNDSTSDSEIATVLHIVDSCMSNISPADGEVIVYVNNNKIRQIILEHGQNFGAARFALRSEIVLGDEGFIVAIESARDIVEAERETDEPVTTAPPLPLIVATDGSINKFYAGGSYAWIANDGNYGYGETQNRDSSLVCELTAIYHSLKELKTTRPIIVLVDNRLAIKMSRDAHSIGEGRIVSKASIALAERINGIVNRKGNVTFRWVKGHSGHPLNEGADRLARNFRLSQSFGNETDSITKNIVDETIAAYSNYVESFV